jgi:hypothetical protein
MLGIDESKWDYPDDAIIQWNCFSDLGKLCAKTLEFTAVNIHTSPLCFVET